MIYQQQTPGKSTTTSSASADAPTSPGKRTQTGRGAARPALAASDNPSPPPEVASGRLPADSQVVDVDVSAVAGLADQVQWVRGMGDDAATRALVASWLSETSVRAHLVDLTSGDGLALALPTYSDFEGAVDVGLALRACVVGCAYQAADGVQVDEAGGTTVDAGVSVTSGQSSQVGVGASDGGASGNVGWSDSRDATSSANSSGSGGSSASSSEGVRFRVDLRFELVVNTKVANLLAKVDQVSGVIAPPTQRALGFGSAVVRFPRARCGGGGTWRPGAGISGERRTP